MNEKMINWIIVSLGVGGSFAMMATASDVGSIPLQVGALGILGWSLWHLLSNIIPDAIKQRQDEQREFLKTMERIANQHTSQMDHLHEQSRIERDKWLVVMNEVTSSVKKNNEALESVVAAVNRCGRSG